MEIWPNSESSLTLREEKEERPLSYGQRALWFLDRLSPGNPAYGIAGAARARGLDARALERAARAVAGRHPALSTTFHQGPEGPVQRAGGEAEIELLREDVSALDPEALACRLSEVAYQPFDLQTGPPWRLALFACGGGEQVLLLAIHHIVADFWSLAVLLRELGALYGAELGGKAADLPETEVDFAQVVAREEALLAGPEGERLWQFWRSALAGVPLVLDLPTDRPRPPVQTYRGGVLSLALPPGLAPALGRLARRSGATLYMALLAAFDVVLHRWTGQERLLVGCPTSGRRSPELQGVVGYLVNPVPIAADFRGEPDFAELLGRVKAAALAAFAHRDYPLPLLAERLDEVRSAGRSPVFQAMCVLQKGRRAGERELAALSVGEEGVRLDFGALALESLSLRTPGAQFDLSLALAETERGIAGRLVYNRDLFEAPTAARFLGHFEVILTALAADPTALATRASDLPLLSLPERQQLLVEWNASPGERQAPGFVHRRIAARAECEPDTIAVVSETAGRMSYGELRARSARIARHLESRGVGPESVVGILAERSFAMVAALLGIWEAGGAYLPLDPALPPERLAFYVADARAALVLADARLAPALPPEAQAVRLDEIWDAEPDVEPAPKPAAEPAPTPGPETALQPDHPAYVLYTSGSTGRPKGVVVPHRALDNRLRFVAEVDLAPGDSVLHKTTIAFDASLAEIFGPLLVGGSVVLARPGGEGDPAYLIELLRRHEIPLASFTMAMLSALLKAGSLAGCPSLRTVLTGGEAVPAELPDLFHSQSAAALFNRYGPTEATISVTSWRCEREPRGRVLPIGRPIARAEVRICDRDLRPLPIGVPGELCIAGECLARGYLDRPELSAEKFVPCPAPSSPGARLYRSGDLARFRPDGAIEFVGRIDSQVKVRGFRVELGEIEAALSEHPALERVAVIDREEPDTGSRRLLAYFVPRPGREVAAADLKRHLLGKVPRYMVPAAFVPLAELPVSPAGKVDRRALPEPVEPPSERAEREPPRGPLEELLAAIWADLLGTEPGRQDDFFALGGHSLLATQVVSRVRQALGVELPLAEVFAAPTLEGLAARIAAARQEEKRPELPPLARISREGPLPLSFAQERLWFLDQLAPGLATYNMPGAFDLAGPLDARAFAASLGEIVHRHEALRTTFAVADGRPVQVVAEAPEDPALSMVDLAALPAAARGAEAARLSREEALRPFDLGRGPLFRAALLRLGPEEHRALLTMHHAVSDGWSVGVLVRELGTLYGAFLAGRTSPLPELPVQYADYAVWQRGWLAGSGLAAQLDFWRAALAGAPEVLDLPTDRPRPDAPSGRGGRVRSFLSREAAAALERGGRSRGATLYMTLLSGFSCLLARYAGQRDVVVGSPIANRTSREVEPLIGFFVNTLALRTELPDDPEFGALVERVRESVLAAYAHQDLPFERLVEELSPGRSLAHSPLFQVMLLLQDAVLAELRLAGLAVRPLPRETAVARFDLLLEATRPAEKGSGLALALEYSRDLFEEATAARMLAHFGNLLTSAAADPGRRLSALPLLGPAEREAVLRAGAGPVAEIAVERVHAYFEAQAERTPWAPAVEMEGEALRYAELEEQANRLAHHLAALGVGPESPVGICLERSFALPVAVLGVLKAGAAYVPLDPGYPPDRLALVVEDARLAALVTTSPLLPRLPAALREGEVPLVLLDQEAAAIAARSAARPAVTVHGENLAYILYTSGSTGRPKGVAMTHRPLANMIAWQLAEAEPRRRTLQFASLSFDVSFQEILSTWGGGGCLVLVTNELRRDARALLRFLRERKIERLFLPFVALQQLAEVLAERADAAEAPALREVMAAGEQLQVTGAIADLFRRMPGCRLENHYGPSEAHVVTALVLEGNPGEWPALPSIGRALRDIRIHLLDRLSAVPGEPVPEGVPGELYVGGFLGGGLARGY